MEVIKEELITFAEAKKMLEKRAQEKELGYEQNNALEYLKKFSKISGKKADEMKDELSKIEKLKERHKVNIVNFMPEDMDDLRIIFAHEVLNLSEDEKKTIISIVKKFA